MRTFLTTLLALLLCACAALPHQEPLQVTVAGIESLPGEGLELRMEVKLRVQNPNETPVDYDGVYVKLDVLNKTFATGVSDVRGTVPRYGEAVISVPVTVSALRVAMGALGFVTGPRIEKVNYTLQGKLDSPGIGSNSFTMNGEMAIPVMTGGSALQ
ncbi:MULTISPECIES: LEA type 2 family protein [Ramlibacter]|uniref:LEA type 2 family protein n=1 Tax=Ramlibacter TaxID=174951 RepID=UPI003084199D